MKSFKTGVIAALVIGSMGATAATDIADSQNYNVVIDNGVNLAHTTHDHKHVNPQLVEHSNKMAQKVYRTNDIFYTFVGYDLAYPVVIDAPEGLIIVDFSGNQDTAARVIEDMKKIPELKAKYDKYGFIGGIYTHNHIDHTGGVKGWLDPAKVESGEQFLIAHENLYKNIVNTASVVSTILTQRSYYSFGMYLEQGEHGRINNGIGPVTESHGEGSFIKPNREVGDGVTKMNLGGLDVEIIYSNSETDDEITIWFPEHDTLHVAEMIQGESFPNLHTLRGTKYRDQAEWYASIDANRKFKADYIIGNHIRPMEGEVEIEDMLVAYRDQIQYTHDQTIRYMNQGMTPDEIVGVVNLPDYMQHPFTGEYYGTVDHAVRAVYSGYLGWFDGDPTTLDPTAPVEKAQYMIDLMGGRDAVLKAAIKFDNASEHQKVAELCTYLVRVNHDDMEARNLKAHALERLADDELNINWRNWYISSARELTDTQDKSGNITLVNADILKALDAGNLVQGFTAKLKAEETTAANMNLKGALVIDGAPHALHIRKAVAEYSQDVDGADFTIKAPKMAFLAVVAGKMTLQDALQQGIVTLEGNPADVAKFFGSFENVNFKDINLTIR